MVLHSIYDRMHVYYTNLYILYPGLASAVFTILGVLNGTSAIWSTELYKWVKPVYSKIFHNITGIAAFVLGKFTCSFTLLYMIMRPGIFHNLMLLYA